jgi:hypothetical protein
MPKNALTRPLLTCEHLEDRITPTISFGKVTGDYNLGGNVVSVAVGDLTGTGRQDMVVGVGEDGVGVQILKNNGDGTFTVTGNINGGVEPNIVKLADMNGDGKLDLVVGSTQVNEVIIYLGNGDGTFQTQNPIVKTLKYNVQDMTIGDLNGDGKPDVVAAIPFGAAVLLNNGTSTVLGAPAYYNASNQPDQAFVAIGDFNGDGKPDLAVSVYSKNLVEIFPNNGDGAFGTPTTLSDPTSSPPTHLVTGDFNNDGDLDLVVGCQGASEVALYEGNGNGTFQSPIPVQTTTSSGIIAAADLDLDGNLDLVVADRNDYSDEVLPGNGDGTFGTAINVNAVTEASALMVAAAAGTGLPDIVSVGQTSPGSYSVGWNDSAVQFGPTSVQFASPQVASGATDAVTIQVDSLAGKPLTDLTSAAFDFNLTGGTSTGSFSAVAETATPGVYAANFTGILGGTSTSLALSIDGVAITPQPTVQVTALPVNGQTTTFTLATSTAEAGATDVATITVQNDSGAALTGLSSSDFLFEVSGGSSTGSFGPVTETSTPGTYTANFTGITAGSALTVTLEVGGVELATQTTLSVVSGAPDPAHITATFAAPTVTAGSTDMLTIAVADAAGNAVSGLSTGNFGFAFTGGASNGTFGPVTGTSTPGTYTANFTGVQAGLASSLDVIVDHVLSNSAPSVQVNAGALDPQNCSVTLASPTDPLGAPDALTIVLEDAEGNGISNNPGINFNYLGTGNNLSDGFITIPQETSTPGTYTADFTGTEPGETIDLELIAGGMTTPDDPGVTVTSGPSNGEKTTVTFAATRLIAGQTTLVTIDAKDAQGDPMTGLTEPQFNLSFTGGQSGGAFGTFKRLAAPGGCGLCGVREMSGFGVSDRVNDGRWFK